MAAPPPHREHVPQKGKKEAPQFTQAYQSKPKGQT